MTFNLKPDTDTRQNKPRPTGALILALYRDDLRLAVGDSLKFDPLLRAALLEAAGLAALHQGRRDAAVQYFDRADNSLALSGRIRPAEAAA